MTAGFGAALSAVALFAFSTSGSAATTTVPCDGNALVGAIAAANSTPEADELQLTAGCAYTLAARNNSFFGYNGLPTVSTSIAIFGNGATIQRDPAALSFRLMTVDVGGALTLRDLTLRNGFARGGDGGSDRGNTDDGGGGGGGAGLGGAVDDHRVVDRVGFALEKQPAGDVA